MKRCRKCDETKPLYYFCADRKNKDGKQAWCKRCKIQSVMNSPSHKASSGRRTKEAGRARYQKGKISFNISRRIRHSIGGKKSAGWEKLLGYTTGDLKVHLEKLFRPGMTWENYGQVWHIDHKKPINSFNITSDQCEDFKLCWSLGNLQPLFAIENIKKGCKTE